MATFSYKTIGGNGAGPAMIDAPDRASAIRALRARGVVPVQVEAVPGGSKPAKRAGDQTGQDGARAGGVGVGSGFSRSEWVSFVREVSTAIRAGLPLLTALKTILRQSRKSSHKRVLGRLIERIEHGDSFSEAAQSIGKPFTGLVISMIRAGESAGRLGEVLGQSARLLDRDLKLRRALIAGMLYPAILGVLIVLAIIVIVTFVVPRILEPMAGQMSRADLPMPTQVVLAVSGFFASYWWLVGLMVAGAVLAWVNLRRQPGPRLSIDRFLLGVPVLGALLRDVAVARFTRTLGTLIGAGLPALQALKITRGTLGNAAMEHVVDEVCEQVSSGKTISDPMERSGYFPGLLVQVIGVGERSGKLPEMLHQAAEVFEEKTEQSVKLFTTAVPPVLVVLAAIVVGFVVLSVILPLLDFQEAIS